MPNHGKTIWTSLEGEGNVRQGCNESYYEAVELWEMFQCVPLARDGRIARNGATEMSQMFYDLEK